MSQEVTRFYRHLSVSETLAVPLQHAMLRYARATLDNELLVRLVGRGDLDPEVDARLGTIGAAPVRAAWVARPGRSAETARAALAGEKRIGVLTALAETHGLGPVAYEALAEREHPKIAAALCANPDTPTSARERSVMALARSSMRTRDTSAAFESALRDNPALADAAALATQRTDAAEVLVRWLHRSQRSDAPVHLGAPALEHLVTGVLAAEAAGLASTTDQWELQRISYTLAQLATLIATLTSLPESVLVLLEDLSTTLQGVPQPVRWGGYTGPLNDLQLALQQARTRCDAGAPDPGTCSGEVLVELAGHALARRDSALAAEIAGNPSAGRAVLEQLRPLLTYGVELDEILAKRKGDLEATTLLLEQVSWTLDFDTAVTAAGGAPAFEAYLQAQLANTRPRIPSHVWQSAALTDELVLGMPLNLVIAACPPDRFARLVQETLTFTDEESWAVAEALMESFTGSLADLRTTVDDLRVP